ncbi:hypothetical protein CKM354_000225600 [Cercospora kikuchii]|uniref:Uncharacterized protein n=1 Tax=Cercospora kikuchii TaxID=84275 RepID=A0A9P3CCH6_9PEZI|nr:uncharacterized protein CKM354_000225600 [Cercospora kikuchii]GIZ38857.1 hypothetical protein CKM354_000225600 [Cercospora kikuchii]
MATPTNNRKADAPLGSDNSLQASDAHLEAQKNLLQYWRRSQAEKDVLEKKCRALSVIQTIESRRVLKTEKKKAEKKIAALDSENRSSLVGSDAHMLAFWFKWQFEEGPLSPGRFPSTGLMIPASFAAFIVQITGEALPEHLSVDPQGEEEEEEEEEEEGFSSDQG